MRPNTHGVGRRPVVTETTPPPVCDRVAVADRAVGGCVLVIAVSLSLPETVRRASPVWACTRAITEPCAGDTRTARLTAVRRAKARGRANVGLIATSACVRLTACAGRSVPMEAASVTDAGSVDSPKRWRRMRAVAKAKRT